MSLIGSGIGDPVEGLDFFGLRVLPRSGLSLKSPQGSGATGRSHTKTQLLLRFWPLLMANACFSRNHRLLVHTFRRAEEAAELPLSAKLNVAYLLGCRLRFRVEGLSAVSSFARPKP